MATIRVFTYNLRIDVPSDGANSFTNRRKWIRKKLPDFQADLIGFQETAPHMCQWIRESFPEYQLCGVGREADLLGESNPVAFRRASFELVSLNQFWLSDTPHVPGSRFSTDQSNCPRVCTAVTLRHIPTGKQIRCYNTHLDHEGPVAQAQGLSLVLARMAEDYAQWQMPVVLMGDFNALPDSLVWKSAQGFAGCGKPLRDVTAELGGTFHDFGRLANPQKIDYIFSNLPCPAGAYLVQDQENGVYLSDHDPVGAELELL